MGLALFVLLALLPIGFSILYAAAYSTGLAGLLSEGFTLDHWRVLTQRSEIWTSFALSIYIAGATVIITVSLALFIALYLKRSLDKGPLSYAIYFPLALPATVAAFFVFQLLSAAGYVARVFVSMGLIDEIAQFPSLVNDAGGIGILVAHIGLAIPFFVLLFHEIYRSENVEGLSALARTLGASNAQVTYRVKAPILLQRATTNITLLFIAVLGSYEIPLLLGRQAPQMISVLTMRKYEMFDISQKPEAFIVALLYTGFVLALLILVFRKRMRTHAT